MPLCAAYGEGQATIGRVPGAACVRYAEPNWKATFTATDDALFPEQWPLHNTGQAITGAKPSDPVGTPDADMDAPEGWDKAFGTEPIPTTGAHASLWSTQASTARTPTCSAWREIRPGPGRRPMADRQCGRWSSDREG